MGLEGIFDPMVRAYFAGEGGSGGDGDINAEGGFCILWDGNIEGREYIDAAALLGVNAYKISDKVLSVADLTNAAVVMASRGVDGLGSRHLLFGEAMEMLPNVTAFMQISGDKSSPVVISAKAGDYDVGGAIVHVPSDGVYAVCVHGDIGVQVAYVEAIYNYDLSRP